MRPLPLHRIGRVERKLATVLFADLVESTRLVGAADHFSQALSVRPDYALAHNNLALVLLDSGQIE